MVMEYEQSANNKEAKEYVDNLPPDLTSNLGGYSYIRRALHSGVDAFGKRLTPEERRILNTTANTLYKRIQAKWIEEGKLGPEGPGQYYRLYDKDIRTELVQRYLSDTSST